MQVSFIDTLANIDPQVWNSFCADDYPFVRYEFLQALEKSGSVGKGTGWQPQHLVIHENDELIAAMPLYLKHHSYGEYVFDWSWADAYKRYGLNYYPKLISAIPFTPCTGARLLLKDSSRLQTILPIVITAIQNHAQELNASSWHCLFPQQDISAQLAAENISQRVGVQFHWFNRDYKSWDDFIATMTSRKRKNINKERRAVTEQGIHFVTKTGLEISHEDWQLFYLLYCKTYLKRSGHTGYLTQSFFQCLQENLSNSCLLVIAYQQQEAIAAALFFIDSKTIYGRYWGCLAEYDFLHFETCYYQGIEYAIKQGLKRFDGGAQGEHKIQRGFEPVFTHSNHWLANTEFQQAIDKFLEAEKVSIEQYAQDAKTYLPFKS